MWDVSDEEETGEAGRSANANAHLRVQRTLLRSQREGSF